MRLVDAEFRAMNTATRRFLQRRLELPVFRRLGLTGRGQDILEIGCGSGYGAELLAALAPASYVGVDVMPEMIELAKGRGLPNAEFLVMDAADLSCFGDASKDTVVIFGILHHVAAWRKVLDECSRVLRPGGMLFVEEPTRTVVRVWDALFHWDHPHDSVFTRQELEGQLQTSGFAVVRKMGLLGFWSYSARKEARLAECAQNSPEA